MLWMALAGIALGGRFDSLQSPYAKTEPLAIRHVSFDPSVPKFGLEELHVDLGATYVNPFDPQEVSLDAKLTGPSGRALDVPGFLFRPFSRVLQNGHEVDAPAGAPEWRVRLAPIEAGVNTVELTLKDRTGTVQYGPIKFTATDGRDPGFVRVSARDHRYFAFDDGTPYFPIGANICWGNDPGTFSYDQWLPDYGKQGCNYGRLWLSPSFTTFALDQPGKPEDGKGIGQYDLASAWKLDYVLKLARENGLYLMLTTESYNVLRDRDSYPYWEHTPENSDNGGPLRVWTQFWTNGRMDELYRNKLRYLVARWGWDTHVLSWEFWNEVDGVRDYDPAAVREWHIRMAAALKAMDPYGHLRTTSFGNSAGERTIDEIADLDYTQTHAYGGADVTGTTINYQTRKAEYGKPHYVGEVGADAGGPETDPYGHQVHDPMWAAIATGGSGGAMCWWWDSLIAPNKLYPLYKAAADFVKGVNFPEEDFRQTDAHVRYETVPKNPPKRDLVLENGPVSWEPSAANQPHQITIDGKGASGQLPLPGILHGLRNHLDLHNPIAIRFDLRSPINFSIEVGDVSGFGGARLEVKLDGEPALTRDFPSNPGSTDTVKKFAGNYDVPVPSGMHVLTIEDTGADWFLVGFRVKDFFTRTAPPLQAYSITGNRTALCWIRNEDDTMRNVVELKHAIPVTPPCVLTIPGLASGRWTAQVWDTWAGKPLQTGVVLVGIDGSARVRLPAIGQDVAVKLTKQGGGNG